jgi:ribose 5-phosphate isomerase B
MARDLVTEQDVPEGGELRVKPGTIFTPSALERIRRLGVTVSELDPRAAAAPATPEKTIAIGSDHGGFQMKQALLPLLAELGYSVTDVGVHEEKAVDYPDIAAAVAELVAGRKATLGVVVDGAGIGSAMAANKVPGVRAALCYDKASAKNSREHNHANVLTLGGRLLTLTQAETVLRTWLATPFGGGRHQARIDKITALERRYSTCNPGN